MKAIVLLGMALATNSLAQTSYIYLHKNATDENSSPDFSINITGPNGFNQTYSLNDQHPKNFVRDVGATDNGGLYAVAGNTANAGGYDVYYRPTGATVWSQFPGAQATRIDGGTGNRCVYVNSVGAVYYFDGTSTYNTGANSVQDVAFDQSANNRLFVVGGNGTVYYRTANSTSGGYVAAVGIITQRIDVAPNGLLVSSSGPNVYITNFDGSGAVNLGSPAGAGGAVQDVAVSDGGIIYAVAANGSDGSVYYYTGGYGAGGSWVLEPTSRNSANITGGDTGQMWAAAGGGQANTIWARTATGFWIDDESVRTTNQNSVIIPVPAGTYSVTEAATSGWSLGFINVYDPSNNSSANVATRTSSVNVSANEVVHVVYRNFLVQSFAVVNTCSGSAYLETFGTGSTTTLGGPLTGQTSYHYISDPTQFMNDGYYVVGSNTNQASGAVPGPYGSYNDHTSGNGTGRMMLVNASFDQGEFFRRRFTGLLPGTTYSFSAWILSLNNATIKPNVRFEINDPTAQATLSSTSTGDITTVGVWQQYQLQFTASQSEVDLVLRNNNIGGDGNDLALDDIRFGLAQPTQPQVSLTNASCASPTASLTVTAPTGPSLEYSLDGTTYQASPVFTNVAPASYSLTARFTNSVGCVSTPVTVLATASICGSVLNDGNGLSDNTVNTSGTGAASPLDGTNVGGSPLYATLLNSSGVAVATVPVTSTGTYSFSGVTTGTYSVVLSTNPAGSTTPSLPASFTNTGENVGTGAGSDATPNGILTGITVGTGSVTNANFGIDKAPAVTASVASPQANPGGTATSPVSSTLFNGTDSEDGAYPTNLTGRSVQLTPATNGSLYYNGTPVSTTQLIPNFDPTKVSLDPAATGATTGTGGASPDPTFTYSVADNAGVYAPPATIRVPFTAALPVSLVSFSAQAQADQTVLVSWQTAWEKDNSQFVIERSKDLLSFEAVGQIRDVAGTSPTGSAYRFVDQSPYRGTSYYRLVQIDQDGTRQLYRAVSVIVDGHYGVWPNPMTGERLTLALDEPATAQIELHSVSGQSIGLRRLEASATTLTLLAESKLAAGVYLLSVRERGTSRQYRLVVL